MGLHAVRRQAVAYDLALQTAYDWAYEAYGVRSHIIHRNPIDRENLAQARRRSEALLQATLRRLIFGGEMGSFKPKALEQAYNTAKRAGSGAAAKETGAHEIQRTVAVLISIRLREF